MLHSLPIFNHSLCCFPSGWVCVCSRTQWVSPTNSPVRLGVSPAAASASTGVFNQWFEALFPCAGTLGFEVCHSDHQLLPRWPAAASLASCSFVHPTLQSATSLGPPAATMPRVLSAWLPVSAPPTGLDECFFFISLVVGLPYSLIFCQFWVFFVFKLLLSIFWLCEEAQYVYLCLHLGRKSASYLLHLILIIVCFLFFPSYLD